MNSSYVLNFFMETPWAIQPGKLAILEEIMLRHVSGEKLTAEEIQARVQGAAPRPQDRRVNTVAVLPLFGTIIPRADFFEEASGATSAEKFGKNFAQLVDDPAVDAIVLDVDSPGGSSYGVEEVSTQIYNARGKKPIIAVVNHLMASAAFWIGTAADEIVITPSGDIGSVGVYSVHQDMSQALEKAGIKLSLISAGKHKVEFNPYEPLGEEARAALQASVNECYDAFVGAVARNRGVTVEVVRSDFGEGRVVSAAKAVELGMADRVGTLEETIQGLLNQGSAQQLAVSKKNNQFTEDGQAPVSVQSQTRLALERERLAVESAKVYTGDTPMLRQLQKERDDLITRATALVENADKEARDLNDEERKEFAEILGVGDEHGKVGALDAKIEQIQAERERLRSAAEKKFTVAHKEEKPSEGDATKALKRAEFAKLDPTVQAAYVKGGGKVED